ncbi:cadherin EGF LAG seven-pass G-type receptor 3-like isoform X5 [Acropora millepora]|nr:cadherin EGF LAG seven-pass G-type receptor 3-like isoform X5 [Acropora millepora]XP_044177365.1 cadherin EGF LAG seven-pass G-type receptor 3-like isoform X5 [Acropora millepora]XP_044177368.1 cadherin EGF LAG seven-pass G-type receptor 3-like isoform X5 [Acropora millepora]
MERKQMELRRSVPVIFLLINFGVFISSESVVIDDPQSTVICISGNTSYDLTFIRDINAGVFTALDESSSVRSCVRKACNMRAPNAYLVAFLHEKNCYMVRCHSKGHCMTKPSDSPSNFRISITPYTWFDAAPVFTNAPKVLQVKENNQRGQIITNIHGHARSRWHNNASIKYTIITGNVGNAFEIRPHPLGKSASLVAAKKLDRETISLYNLTIQATNTEENKTSTKVFSVNVLDENDNEPLFSRRNYSVTIFSNLSAGSEVLRVRATDRDIGENARIRFSLLHLQSLFRILPQSGTILLNQKVRVDRRRDFTLIVAARNGAYKNIVNVVVRVIPVNENRPFFENLKYNVKVSEALKVGNSVTKVLARDFDYGTNGALNFTIIAGNMTYFKIDEQGVVRTRKSLLTLGGLNCSLTLVVSDKGNPPKRSEHIAIVFITIEEINKHKVKFDLPIYHVAVAENTPVGATILTVRAVIGIKKPRLIENIPQVEGRLERKSKRVVYSIANPDGHLYFSIGKHTGDIKNKGSLDYEKVKEYRLVLFAKDTEKQDENGHHEIDTSEVYVHVLDLNDNAPRFVLDMYQKVISENVSVDSAILRVTATDPDSGTNGQVHYAIEGGNTNNTFDLDNQGVLRLQQSLKTQDTNLFNLTIRARDHGLPPKVSSPVSVYVSVKRSALPCKQKLAFQQGVYLANVNESTPVNTNILRVQAKMGDCGFKGRITYFLSDFKDPEIDNYFVINAKTGVIRLIRPLDFEVRDRYTFSVAAVGIRTQGNVDTAHVRISVLDENDHKPHFTKLNYQRLLTTLPEPGTSVAMLTATDGDEGKNKELEYFLISGSDGFFRINGRTGVITTTKILKRQNLRLFNITVSVSDHGTPPLTAERQARVSILVFTPLQSPFILIYNKATTMTIRFDLKNMASSNIAQYGVIVQEYSEDESNLKEITKKEPTTWYLVNKAGEGTQVHQRFIAKILQSNVNIAKSRVLDVTIGDEERCENKRGDKDYCNGPLKSGKRYRFQLRAYLKSTGPFSDVEIQDSALSDPHYTVEAPDPKASATRKNVGRRSYDAVVYSVGSALVVVIILAFLRGFYRLKLDRKRIHEEKKRRISFPISNPRFQEPTSPVEKIRNPGPAKTIVAVNHDKGSEFIPNDEDEGSSPDSALDETTRLTHERRRPTLQEVRLKNYFNSVESSSCASCEHVKIYCVQETTT